MKRKELWKRIQCAALAAALLVLSPAFIQITEYSVSAESEGNEEEPDKKEEPDAPPAEPPAQPDPEPEVPVETNAPTIPEVEPTPGGDENGGTGDGTEADPQPGTEGTTQTETSQSESETGTPDTNPETESETAAETETEKLTEKETETESESESEAPRYVSNIIASNAAYLGKLSSLYGLSFSDSFREVPQQVEEEFKTHLTDPDAYQTTNWKEVFAVFFYEAKRQNAAEMIGAEQKELLMDVYMKMNAPDSFFDIPEEILLEDVFVEEYPITDELQQVDAYEQEMIAMLEELPDSMSTTAKAFIEQQADDQRTALKALKKEQMDIARVEKWERLNAPRRDAIEAMEKPFSSKMAACRTIDDYVAMEQLNKAAKEEIEEYASLECMQLCAIASASRPIVRASLGNEISEERVGIVTAAYSLVGRIGYFWGGKSNAIGWDPAWGNIAQVWAAGDDSSGTYRPLGLDCSGFTLYCYRNGLNGSDAGIGGHTTSQWNASVMVDQKDAKAGDLVFLAGPERGNDNHVGVVVGKTPTGGLVVAHCSGYHNGVVVGEAFSSGFNYVRTVSHLA